MIHNYKSYKTSLILPFVAIISLLLFNSCSDNGSGPEEPESEIEAETVLDLHAPDTRSNPNARFVLFSLRTGQTVDIADSASTNWDIGFRGTSVIVNSGTSGPGSAGAVVLDTAFEEVTIAPETGYSSDTADTNAISGWYNYTGQAGTPQHAIISLDKTIILRTADGNHYGKLEIMSYYEGNPDTSTESFANLGTRPDGGYFTFRYAVQLEEGLRDLE